MSAAVSMTLDRLPRDEQRGTRAMALFIATEAALFVVLLFAYFYLRAVNSQWMADAPPKLTLALTMLVILLVSSATVFAAEWFAKQRRVIASRLAILATWLLGVVFLCLQFFEYRDHLRVLKPSTDAYGSIFYTITSVHGCHVILGLLMLGYAGLLHHPDHEPEPPYRALHNAAIYWHFVDVVWIVVVALLYVLANAGARP
jgi:heme/copper-type cytochrome/quinol oxidase subunit 3